MKDMSFNPVKHTLHILWILAVVVGILSPHAISAQSGAGARIVKPTWDEFPLLNTYLDVFQSDGAFLSGLDEDQIKLQENGQARPILKLQELNPGVQLVVALNVAPPFGIQDINGNSRWDYLARTLSTWLAQEPLSSNDDLSILSNDGLEKTHRTDRKALASTIDRYQPRPRQTASNLNVLSHAIEVAGDPPPSLGMKKAVLLLTPPPTPEDIAALQNLTALALENQIRIYPWLISSPAYFDSAGARQLQIMAEETGGKYFAFSGEETLPDLASLFQTLRGTYLIQYRSQITSGGTHQISAVIDTGTEEINASREFSLNIQPPNPILVSPPAEIVRRVPRSGGENTPPSDFQPRNQQLQVIIEFPDGIPRALEKTSLKINGKVEDTNTSAPFDTFTWDLTSYQQTQTLYVAITVEDTLGLTRTSVQTPIQVIVEQPDFIISNFFLDNLISILGLGTAVLALIILYFLLKNGVIHPKDSLGKNGETAVQNGKDNSRQPEKRYRILISRDEKDKNAASKPYALLIPEEDPARDYFTSPIPLEKTETTLGNDPSSAIIAIKDPSVAALHARLLQQKDGSVQVIDQGSISGTWINYDQLPQGDPALLEDGDLLHIGRVGFRFQTQSPAGSDLPTSMRSKHSDS